MAQIKSVHEFQDAWRWPEDVERFVREQVPDGRVLNVPTGQSPLGDVKVDAEPSPHGDCTLAGDMFTLPFQDATFDGVIADPPWRGVDRFQRHQLFYELVRVTKPDGLIIHNATWVPDSDQVEIVGEYRRADGAFNDLSAIVVYRRYANQATLGDFEESAPVAVCEPETSFSVRRARRGIEANGTLVIDGPDGRLVATKTYRVPSPEQVSPDGEQLRVEESIRYSMPDVPSPDRVEDALPPRRGSVPLSTAVLGDPEAVEQALREAFRDDPQLEYQAVRRRLRASPEDARGARPTRV